LSEGTLVPLNRTEHLFWACEGYLGSITQPYMMRLDAPVDVALVRQALRELTSAYPRLRSRIVPTGWTYKLQLLPDDHLIDQLFADAFRVQTGVDADSHEALEAFHNTLLNDALSMERGLPWRARFIAHPTRPVLVFALHHIIGDGRSNLQMIGAVLARISGKPIPPCPLQSPSMVAAVAPTSWAKWPASILGWWRNTRRDAQAAQGQKVITLASRVSPRFTTSSAVHHELPCSPSQLRTTAKRYGTTINNLMTAVIANSFLAREPNNPQAVAAIRISLDLRRLFPEGQQPEIGNFVASFAMRATRQPSLSEQIHAIEAMAKDYLARYERREAALPLMFYELLPIMGRRLYSYLIVKAKAGRRGEEVSCHFSNLGSGEHLNPKDAQARITELWVTTLGITPILGFVSLGDKMFLTVGHQNDEIEPATVRAFLGSLDDELRKLVAENPPA
jgi:NRPS condensation-like uncharacterized protein